MGRHGRSRGLRVHLISSLDGRIRDERTIGRETAICAGRTEHNGFYGHGIVNAYAAVLGR